MSHPRVLCCLSAALALLLAQSASAASITVVRSSLKVRPDDAPAGASTASISAARNEFEAFQVVVRAGATRIDNVNLSKPTLTREGGGGAIPATDVRLYRAHNVTLTQASSLDQNTPGSPAAGEWPDALIPQQEDGPAISLSGIFATDVTSSGETRSAFQTSVQPHKNAVFWVDIRVPATALIGRYTGTLIVTGSEGGVPVSLSVPVALVVRDITLPSTSSLKTYWAMSSDAICRGHGARMGGSCPDAVQAARWNRLYSRFLLDHRLSSKLDHDANPNDWTGTFNTYLNNYGSFIQGTDPASRLSGARMTSVLYPWVGSDGELAEKAKLQQWVNFSRTHGFFERSFDYLTDEPGTDQTKWDQVKARADWDHAVDPAFRTLVTANIEHYTTYVAGGVSSGAANLLVPLVQHLDGNSGFGGFHGNQRDPAVQDRYAAFLAHNPINEVWSYQSCVSHGCNGVDASPDLVNWPNFMVDATGVQNRSEPWMHFIYGLSGMLYYEPALMLPFAWNAGGLYPRPPLLAGNNYGGNGDGTLVYPGTPTPSTYNQTNPDGSVAAGTTLGIGGTTHIPIASIRLKLIREGLEDYEYLKQCAAVNPATARTIARTLFPMRSTRTASGRETGSMYSANQYPSPMPAADADRLEQARGALAACIESGAVKPITRITASSYELPAGLAVDGDGNIYITGITNGPIFPPYAGGAYDAFIAKYSPEGVLQWSSQAGLSASDGEITASLVLDPAQGLFVLLKTYVFTSGGAYSHAEHFLVHFDVNGNRVWKRQVQLADPTAEAQALLNAGSGEFYVVGLTQTPPDGVPVDPEVGYDDVFVARIGLDAGVRWFQAHPTPRFDYPTAVKVTPDGLVAAGTDCESFYCNDPDAFVMKWTATGTVAWRAHIESLLGDEVSGVTVDAQGRTFACGSTQSHIFDAGGLKPPGGGDADATVWAFSSSGTLFWSDQFGGSGDDYCGSVAVDASGNLLLGGHTRASVNGSSNAGETDWFVAKYSGSALSATSTPLWSVMGGTADVDYVSRINVSGGTVTLLGGVYPSANMETNDIFVLQLPAVRGGL